MVIIQSSKDARLETIISAAFGSVLQIATTKPELIFHRSFNEYLELNACLCFNAEGEQGCGEPH